MNEPIGIAATPVSFILVFPIVATGIYVAFTSNIRAIIVGAARQGWLRLIERNRWRRCVFSRAYRSGTIVILKREMARKCDSGKYNKSITKLTERGLWALAEGTGLRLLEWCWNPELPILFWDDSSGGHRTEIFGSLENGVSIRLCPSVPECATRCGEFVVWTSTSEKCRAIRWGVSSLREKESSLASGNRDLFRVLLYSFFDAQHESFKRNNLAWQLIAIDDSKLVTNYAINWLNWS